MNPSTLSFKLKLTKKDFPGIDGTPIKVKLGGIYDQVKQGNVLKYNKANFSLQDIKDAIGAIYTQPQPQQRKVKLITNQAGMDLFNEALNKELLKQSKKDEYRQKFSLRSKIFKQTYKFG